MAYSTYWYQQQPLSWFLSMQRQQQIGQQIIYPYPWQLQPPPPTGMQFPPTMVFTQLAPGMGLPRGMPRLFPSLQGGQSDMQMQEEPPTLGMNTLWLLSHLREPKLTKKIQVYLLHGRKPELNMKFEEMAASIYEEYMKLPSLQGGQPDMSMQEELPTLGMNTLWLLSHLREPKYTEKVQVYLLYGRKPTLNMEFEEMAEVINEKYRKEIFPQEEMTIYEFIQNFQDEGATIYECIQNFLDEYKMLQSDMPVEEEQPLGMNTLWLLSHLQKPELTKKVQVQLLYGRKPELNMKFEEIAAFIYEEYMTEIYPQEGKTIYELAQTVLDKFPSLQGGQPGMPVEEEPPIVLGMKTLWLLSHLRERKYTEKVQVYLLYGRKPELNMEFEEMAASIYDEYQYMTENPQEGKTIYELAQSVVDKFLSLQGGQTDMPVEEEPPILGMNTLWLLSHLREPKWLKKIQVYLLYENKTFNMELEVVATRLKKEYKTEKIFPPEEKIFYAFTLTPLDEVKVVILGQDPYHNDGQAMGLAFSVPMDKPPPPSLKNIYEELKNEYPGFTPPDHGCLENWAKQGVLLLNATLTVKAHLPKSHSKKGYLAWQKFTDVVIEIINNERSNVVFILMGEDAKKKGKIINRFKHPDVIETAHPSPRSWRKFEFCNVFRKADSCLIRSQSQINWCNF